MRAIDPACAIDFQPQRNVHALTGESNRELTRTIGALLEDSRPCHAGFGSEAGVLQDAGIPTVVCGPGEMKGSHLSDESVSISQLEQCNNFLRRLGQHLASDAPLLGEPDPAVAGLFR